MMAASDTDFIVGELSRRFPELVRDLYPGAVEINGRVYPSFKHRMDRGSFEICLTGAKAGHWFRNSQGVGGQALQLIAYALTGSTVVTRETFDYARRFLGIERREPSPDEARRRQDAILARQRAEDARRAEMAAKDAADRERRLETASGLWDASSPVTGSPAELYLLGRGLHLPAWPDALRCHRSLPHPDGGRFPAMVCRVDDINGVLTGVWRIFVTEQGQKAPVSNVKLGLGPTAGGAVRLFPAIGGEIGIAEGVETALAVHVITQGKVAMWAGLSTSGVRGFTPPFEIERIRVFPDADVPARDRDGKWRPSPGLSAAHALKDSMDAEGIACTIEPGPRGGMDYLDVLGAMQDANHAR
jgi:putative DNA primase/helicase